jgi:glycosyltransferase involved in cell wall biosynthesis
MLETIIKLDPDYSTTRNVMLTKPVIKKKPLDKYESLLFLTEGENRQGEGGLRSRGYFKTSKRDNNPLITVVTIVFNGEQHIEETIKSVISQDYDNVEYIVIDGGSTDGTLDIIRRYEQVIDYWVSEKDRGISDAFNKGVILACGELIAFLNADDFYYDKKVLSVVSQNYVPNEKILIYGKTKKLTEDNNILDKKDNEISWCMSIPFSHCSSFLDIKIYKEIGLFSCDFKIAMDVDLLLRSRNKVKLVKINEFLGVQREGGISDKQRLQGYREYVKAAIPFFGIKAYFYYLLKIVIVLKTRLKR